MPMLHVLRVFVGPDGRGGNPLGIFLDGSSVPAGKRQLLAAELGFSETVFVDDADTGAVRIFTPAAELGFAGHPLVGTAWLLATRGTPVETLRPPAGEVATWIAGGLTWIRGRAVWAPPMQLRRLRDPAAVEALSGPPETAGSVYVWAWEDQQAGHVRSRFFAADLGITEDEATGSAAVRLGHALGRPVRIRQGRASVLYARPGPDGTVDVGGSADLVRTVEWPVPA